MQLKTRWFMALEMLELWAQLAAGKCVESPVQIQNTFHPDLCLRKTFRSTAHMFARKWHKQCMLGTDFRPGGKVRKLAGWDMHVGARKLKIVKWFGWPWQIGNNVFIHVLPASSVLWERLEHTPSKTLIMINSCKKLSHGHEEDPAHKSECSHVC